MNKELEALEELKNGLFGHCKSSYLKNDKKELNAVLKVYEEQYNIIKSALERLEIIKDILKKDDTTNHFDLLVDSLYSVCDTNEEFEEKYDLLKGVLEK